MRHTELTSQTEDTQPILPAPEETTSVAPATLQEHDELLELTYTLVHDLRVPLRAMHGFTSILQTGLQGKLDEKHARLMDKVCDSVEQVAAMLEYVMQSLRILSSDLQKTSVDLAELAYRLWPDICQAHAPNSKPILQVEQDLYVTGDQFLLLCMLQNLLSNAVKYSAQTARPHVRLESRTVVRPDDQKMVRAFVVEDNGIGFDERHALHLFRPMQRMHSQQSGVGIGLAIVKRVVERHGGEIWATAEINRGACFYFTLPS